MSKNNSRFNGKRKATVGAELQQSQLPAEVVKAKFDLWRKAQKEADETLTILKDIRDDEDLNTTARVSAASQILKWANDVEPPPKESVEEAELEELEHLSTEKLHELLLKELGKEPTV